MSVAKYLISYCIKILVDSVTDSTRNGSGLVKGSHLTYLVFALLFGEAMRRYKSYFQFQLLPRIKKYIYDVFLERMLKYRYEYYHKKTSNVLLNSLRNLSEGSEEMLINLKDVFWKTCVVLMSVVGSACIIHKNIGFILLTWCSLWIIICIFFVRASYGYSLKLYSSKNEFVKYLGDIFNNITTVKAFNTSNYEGEESKENSDKVLKIELENNFLFLKVNVINTGLFFFFLMYSFIFLYSNSLATPGNFILLFTSLVEIYSQLDDLNENFCDISDVSGQINDAIQNLYKEIPKSEDRKSGFEVTKGEIIIKDLTCHSPNDRTQKIFAIDGEIKIAGGSTVAIVGTSGAGKSTLFRVLLGLMKHSGGQVLIDGQNLFEYNLSSVRSAFALIPQDVGLFHRTVLENIQYGSFDKNLEEIVSVVEQTKLKETINELKYGYNSIIGKDCNLSGGQKQRMILARGLLKNAKIFLFDESTSALDAKTENDILTSISEITKGFTKLIIAHRLKTVKHADLILVFDQGKLIQKGTHDQLIKEDGLYSNLMDLM